MANPTPFTPEEVAQILEAFFAAVGTRQYIGARYVPIFGRKGEASIVWDNTAPYEPLTIVLYQGNSYTSRQYVPAGVEITNAEFWAETGNYNAQVEQYRQEVLTFDGRIDTLESQMDGTAESDLLAQINAISDTHPSGDILLIGDSYSQGYTPDGQVNSWSAQIRSIIQENMPNTTVYKYDMGGYGFGNGGFTTLINNAVAALTETQRKNVSTILIGGGYNDWSQTGDNIRTGMANVMAAIKTSFTNAKRVIIADFGNGVAGLTSGAHAGFTYATRLDAHKSLCLASGQYGYACPYNAVFLLDSLSYYSSDYVHPNATGQNIIRNYVLGLLYGVEGYTYRTPQTVNIMAGTAARQITLTQLGNGVVNFKPLAYTYEFPGLEIARLSATGSNELDLNATLNFNATLQYSGEHYMPANGFILAGGRYYDFNGMLAFKRSADNQKQYKLSIYPIKINADGNGFAVYENITSVRIQLNEAQIVI